MQESPDQRALAVSTVALVVALASAAMFIPPLVEHTVATPLRSVATGLALAAALVLHWVFLGLAARRMKRSVAAWLGLAVLLFPVGSVAALILLNWFGDEARAPAAQQG